MIREGGTYYLFATGRGIAVWSSPDRTHWIAEKPVFAAPPPWAVAAVPSFKGHVWAPDISFADGRYYLYYSVSAFGRNTSCIGLATNVTLDPRDPRFRWEDHGKVVQSFPGRTNWNAIDPNLIVGEDGTPYLAFGSFWSGIQIAKLTPDRMQLAENPDRLRIIASRVSKPAGENPPAVDDNPKDAGGNAIEAPFIFRRGPYFYLFASIDYCCKGRQSTYKMIVGRAQHVVGPYLDRTGVRMDRGGGTLLLAGDEQWYGVGHNAVCTFDGTDYLVFHGYDASDNGKPKLRIEPLVWDDDGWPSVAQRPHG
ncbi:arabinan endo-1,5-alpha-L-arabinosidase [Opitutaceae bacterium EW11]|nr:arabinan endo-1,5-alpha-L-arabinosidase [Opitutaceae bacterium EW11]